MRNYKKCMNFQFNAHLIKHLMSTSIVIYSPKGHKSQWNILIEHFNALIELTLYCKKMAYTIDNDMVEI